MPLVAPRCQTHEQSIAAGSVLAGPGLDRKPNDGASSSRGMGWKGLSSGRSIVQRGYTIRGSIQRQRTRRSYKTMSMVGRSARSR